MQSPEPASAAAAEPILTPALPLKGREQDEEFSWSGTGAVGMLAHGLVIQGHRFRQIVVRPATMRDSIEAIEEIEKAGGNAATYSQTRLRYEVMARCVSFTNPGSGLVCGVTGDELLDLSAKDGMTLERAADFAEKKLDELSTS